MNTITERKFHCLLLLLLFALLMMVVCSISLGRYYISPVHVVKIILAPLYPMVQDWSNQASSVIYTLRLPRALAAMMIGAALSLSGASYQSVFKNPLVAPDMLGVSSGALCRSFLVHSSWILSGRSPGRGFCRWSSGCFPGGVDSTHHREKFHCYAGAFRHYCEWTHGFSFGNYKVLGR